MTPATEKSTIQNSQFAPGREVTPKVFSAVKGIPENTLATWRLQDKRTLKEAKAATMTAPEPTPGRPVWKAYGRAIRYWLEPNSYDPALLATIAPTRYKPRKKPVQAAVEA